MPTYYENFLMNILVFDHLALTLDKIRGNSETHYLGWALK